MQIQISAEDVFTVYKEQLGEMHHELIMAKIQIEKLKAALAEYEQAEVDRFRIAAAQRDAAQNATGATETAPQPGAGVSPPQEHYAGAAPFPGA